MRIKVTENFYYQLLNNTFMFTELGIYGLDSIKNPYTDKIILEKTQQKFNSTKYNVEYLFGGDTHSSYN
jgi:hypothetical protein